MLRGRSLPARFGRKIVPALTCIGMVGVLYLNYLRGQPNVGLTALGQIDPATYVANGYRDGLLRRTVATTNLDLGFPDRLI